MGDPNVLPQAVKALPEFQRAPLCVCAKGQMGVNAAYAALFEPEIQTLKLEGLPASQLEGPDYLNVLKVGDIPQVLALLGRPSTENPRTGLQGGDLHFRQPGPDQPVAAAPIAFQPPGIHGLGILNPRLS